MKKNKRLISRRGFALFLVLLLAFIPVASVADDADGTGAAQQSTQTAAEETKAAEETTAPEKETSHEPEPEATETKATEPEASDNAGSADGEATKETVTGAAQPEDTPAEDPADAVKPGKQNSAGKGADIKEQKSHDVWLQRYILYVDDHGNKLGDVEDIGKYKYTCRDIDCHDNGENTRHTFGSEEFLSGVTVESGSRPIGWTSVASSKPGYLQFGESFVGYKFDSIYIIVQKTGIDYRLEYNANGGEGAPEAQKATVWKGEQSYTFDIPDQRPTKKDFKFLGWADDPDATVPDYYNECTVEYPQGYSLSVTKIIYAVWEKNIEPIEAVTLTYDGNDATSGTAPEPQTVNKGETVKIQGQGDLVKEGYTFRGWSMEPSTTEPTQEAGTSMTLNESCTLYAVWEPIDETEVVELQYMDHEERYGEKETYQSGTLVSVKDCENQHEGYVFQGWDTNASAGVVKHKAGDSLPLMENTTLYAVWVKEQVTVTIKYVDEDGEVLEQTKCFVNVDEDYDVHNMITSTVVIDDITYKTEISEVGDSATGKADRDKTIIVVCTKETEQTEPAEPGDGSGGTTEPGGGSTTPTTPIGPTDPAEPSNPTTPSEPTVPSEPTNPTTPSEPTLPTEPSDPTVPSEPTVPVVPEDPDVPTTPATPSNPTTPTGPTTPAATGNLPTVTPAAIPAVAALAPAAAPAAAAAPAVTAVADEPVPLANEPEADNQDLQSLEDGDVPLAQNIPQQWALLNLILAILTVLVSAVLLIGYFTRKKKDDEQEEEEQEVKRKGLIRVLSVIPAIGAVILFLLTEDMSNPMALTDQWTVWMFVIALVNVAAAFFSKKSEKDQDNDQGYGMA